VNRQGVEDSAPSLMTEGDPRSCEPYALGVRQRSPVT